MKKTKHENDGKRKWGMVIDLDKCTGCKACVIACKSENNLQTVSAKEARRGRISNWINIKPMTEGAYPPQSGSPRLKTRYLPLLCNHCDNAPCIKVCPVRATYRNEEGLIAQIYNRCIGCRYCACACPYTAKTFNWFTPEFPESMQYTKNPDVYIRPKGIVEKCSFCHHRLLKARGLAKIEGRSVEVADYQPACVEICPPKAMVFGDMNDDKSLVHELISSADAFGLLEELGTEPKVTYLSEGRWQK